MIKYRYFYSSVLKLYRSQRFFELNDWVPNGHSRHLHSKSFSEKYGQNNEETKQVSKWRVSQLAVMFGLINYVMILFNLILQIKQKSTQKKNVLSHSLITQKLFLGSRIKKILYMPSERALKMLSFDGNIRGIGSRGGVGEHI